MNLPALMYHDVVAPDAADASGFPGAAAAHYKLDAQAFSAHLAALSGSGLRFAAVHDATASDAPCCALTFDDGGASAVRIAQALEAHDMVGHFFITTARIGHPGFVTAADIAALHAQGHVIGSHSHTHPSEISRLDSAELDAQWMHSIDALQQILGTTVDVASVPGGFYARRVAHAAAAAGIRHLFTSEPTVRSHQVDGCRVLGRYTLWRGMPPETALALACGHATLRQRQWLAWNLKKPLKRFAGPLYRWLRRGWLTQS
jgi:peptidoglycan/xylan/chitin deacetylase (PgdA/CDA1 family)